MIKNKRRGTVEEALKKVLQTDTVGTQEEIKAALDELGHDVNQTKISRLLRKVGAIKGSNEDNQAVYTLPVEPLPAAKNLLSHLITHIRTNETLIVIYTNPGSASLIGRLLDHHREKLHILGTVAGDDTIFVAPRSIKKINKSLQLIQTFLNEEV
jgi:transcriptional regulator of arginine metabolism